MDFKSIEIRNWRNFKSIKFEIGSRLFIVGPNASGKSNLLDAFRFLRDISSSGGGLQKAVSERGGMSKIRCLMARSKPNIEFIIELNDQQKSRSYLYELEIMQEPTGTHRLLISKEKVTINGDVVLDRPDKKDKIDVERRTQTHLEQINSNEKFRDINEFFNSFSYQHLVPQLIRHADLYGGQNNSSDPFGCNFMERVSKTSDTIRKIRLEKIGSALKIFVPQFQSLGFKRDAMGIPHLEAVYTHWRSQGAKQQEIEFSDGTLRLIGMLWSLFDGDSLLLIEEPELYLNSSIVSRIPDLIYKIQKSRRQRRQIIISTHSPEIIQDKSIKASEVLLLTPSTEGTIGKLAKDILEIEKLMESGFNASEAVIPYTAPENIRDLETFG